MGKVMIVVLVILAVLVGYLGLAHVSGWLEEGVVQRIMIMSASIFVLVSICSLMVGALKGKHD